jgi:hypothetical protein
VKFSAGSMFQDAACAKEETIEIPHSKMLEELELAE